MSNFEIKDRFIVIFTNNIKKKLQKFVGKPITKETCQLMYNDIYACAHAVFQESKIIVDKEKVTNWFSDAVYLMVVPSVPDDAGFNQLPLPHKPHAIDFCTQDVIQLLKILDQTRFFTDLEQELQRRVNEDKN